MLELSDDLLRLEPGQIAYLSPLRSGPDAGTWAITVPLAPFSAADRFDPATFHPGSDGPVIIETEIRCDFIELPGNDLSELANRTFDFPVNPHPGYIDWTIYLVGVSDRHVPALRLRCGSGVDRPGVVPTEVVDRGPAAVPDEMKFATKPQQAQAMLDRAIAAEVPFAWFTADEAYGQNPGLRDWLEEQDVAHVMATRCDDAVASGLFTTTRVDQLIARVPAGSWTRLSCGDGCTGRTGAATDKPKRKPATTRNDSKHSKATNLHSSTNPCPHRNHRRKPPPAAAGAGPTWAVLESGKITDDLIRRCERVVIAWRD